MKIEKDRFDAWASSVWTASETYNPSRVAKVAGISKSSFFFQRNKGYVESSVVIALCRALTINPLQELLAFPECAIFNDASEPQPKEVLSQVSPECLMEELLGRLRHEEVTHYPHTMPEPYGLKRWLDTTELHGQYAPLAEAMGLASVQVLSKKITENRLTLGQLIDMCHYGKLNSRFGLVVTGMMTFEEVGYPWNIREKVLHSSPGETVIDALWGSRKWLERAIQVKGAESGVFRTLG